MSHELRTPLNAVIGFSEVLLDKLFGDVNARQQEYLEDIRSSGLHLLELLNEILDLSKVEAGRMELEPAPFSVLDALRHTVSLVRERAAQHGITLDLSVEDEVGEIDSDQLRFKQVVLNLVSNAVKFTPDGGHVSVAAAMTGDDLRVSVTDTGVGVRPEDRERIFESFQQGRRGPAKEEGTGLGLTLCRRIVELLGGRMWLDTSVGSGSTFGFAIPVVRAGAPHLGSTGEPGAPRGRLLLVDDDRASLDLMNAYLTGTGLELVRARDGDEALVLARRMHPSAVVLDIRLPKLDGWRVLQELKRDASTAAIPVIIASIVDEPARGRTLGAAGYLTKPVGREDLLDALRRVGVPAPLVTAPAAEGAEP
jgi:CheY-like chemotaxis protein